MACPTCDHTMAKIGIMAPHDDSAIYWCERCGTIKAWFGYARKMVPSLVERCDSLHKKLRAGEDPMVAMQQCSIKESISKEQEEG